jgi:nicotinic acid mononucleotide adenylyltransferase
VLLARWVLENSDAEAGISWSGVSELVVGRDEESCQDRWEMLERMTEASERRRRGRASTSLKRKKTKTTTTTKANSSRSKSTKTKAKPTARKR